MSAVLPAGHVDACLQSTACIVGQIPIEVEDGNCRGCLRIFQVNGCNGRNELSMVSVRDAPAFDQIATHQCSVPPLMT